MSGVVGLLRCHIPVLSDTGGGYRITGCGCGERLYEPGGASHRSHLAAVLTTLLAQAWEEGRCAASRGVKSNPYATEEP